MVRQCIAVSMAFTLFGVLSTGAFASTIETVRVVGDGVVRVKPCEPAFVLLDVTYLSSTKMPGHQSPSAELATRVVVDERQFDIEFSTTGMNPAAVFSLSPGTIRRIDDKSATCRVVAMLLWDYTADMCLFSEPGRHHVEFYPGASVNVVVETPSQPEEAVIAHIRGLGLSFPAFLMNLSDRKRTKDVAPRIEQLLKEHPGTAHEKYLMVCLGVANFPTPRGKQEREGFVLEEFLDRRVAFARDYFEPYCRDGITSPYEAMAAYYLGSVLLDRARHASTSTNHDTTAERARALTLLETVRDSPYSLGYQHKAVSMLRELEPSRSHPRSGESDSDGGTN